ncbi:hypothetical protein CPB86DRAFT_869837 [Serendipita vermifera]|nr:hypothetical protein CPB86DRAFT_869837 [Serendipita vermifera]
MRILPRFSLLDRELVPQRQTKIERWSLALLRKAGFLPPRFPVSLPFEIWSIILWYVLEPAISPHTFCNSDTFPNLFFQLFYTRCLDTTNWSRCRLVCRTWKEIMDPCPFLKTSFKDPPPEDEELTRVTSLFLTGYKTHDADIETLLRRPQLTSQVTVLFIYAYSRWRVGQPTLHFHERVDFSNLRCLCIGWAFLPRDKSFWGTLSKCCPRLVLLSVRGKLPLSKVLDFPLLETLAVQIDKPLPAEPSYNIPKLTHLSFTGKFVPERLLHEYGPFLHSLLYHSPSSLGGITERFWKHYAALRTLGIRLPAQQTFVSPPPEHPLRHLCFFFIPSVTQRIRLIQAALVHFPLIRKLSIEISSFTGREKSALLRIAKRSGFELHFLSSV